MFGLVSYDGSRKTTRKIIPLETKLIFHGTLFFTSVKLWEEECSNVFQIGGSTMNYVYEYLCIHNNTWYIYKLIICGYFMAISLLTNGLVLVMFFILLVPLSRHVRDLFSGWGRRPEILRRWVVWGRRPKKPPKTPKPRRKSPPHVGSKIRQFQYSLVLLQIGKNGKKAQVCLQGGDFLLFVACNSREYIQKSLQLILKVSGILTFLPFDLAAAKMDCVCGRTFCATGTTESSVRMKG